MEDRVIIAVVAVIAAILGAIQTYRTKGEDLGAVGLVVLSVGLVVVYLTD